jgi:hypothetical protein
MIVNSYITAPNTRTTGPCGTYIENTGLVTLVASVRDSVTGGHLGLAVNTEHGRRSATVQLASNVANFAGTRRALTNGRKCYAGDWTVLERAPLRRTGSPRKRLQRRVRPGRVEGKSGNGD